MDAALSGMIAKGNPIACGLIEVIGGPSREWEVELRLRGWVYQPSDDHWEDGRRIREQMDPRAISRDTHSTTESRP